MILLVLIFTLFPFVQMLSTSLKHQFDWGNPSLIPVKVNLNAYEELLGFQKKDVQVPESIKRLLDNPKLSEDKKKKIILKFSKKPGDGFVVPIALVSIIAFMLLIIQITY